MSYLFVIPSIHKPTTVGCLDTLKVPRENVMVVDNTVVNRGVGGSWNLGIDRVLAEDRDWLVICSAAMRFGKEGGLDFVEKLYGYDKSQPHVDGIPLYYTLAVEAANDIGWHLIAFRRNTLEKVGYFDELFYPGYEEDIDMSWRIQKAYGLGPKDFPLFPKVDVDASLLEVAHGIKRGNVQIDLVGQKEKYRRKWGDTSPNEKWERPYNNPLLNWRSVERRPYE